MFKIIFFGPYLTLQIGTLIWNHAFLVNTSYLIESLEKGIDITAGVNKRTRELQAMRRMR